MRAGILSRGFVGLVVMTLALHARGPRFNPGRKYYSPFFEHCLQGRLVTRWGQIPYSLVG